MQTILVLDNQPPHVATQALEGVDAVLVVVNDRSRARHVLLNMTVDLWICDLSVDDLSYRALHAEAMMLNAKARILLTGPAVSHLHASALLKAGLARQFIAKPWPPLSIKRTVNDLLHQTGATVPPAVSARRLLGKPPSDAGPDPAAKGGVKRLLKVPREPQLRIKTRAAAAVAASAKANDGRYRLDELIGEGGMGRIYRAQDTLLDMEVAVKLLSSEFSRDEAAIATLKEETRLCLQLLHRHIVRVYNLEQRHDLFLIIMEYVKGLSLYQYMEQMPQGLPPDTVVQIVAVMGHALSYAHRKGVLHKDITPGNVIISDDGILKLIDFGIADRVNRQKVASEYIIGTPVYMSPEQLRGETLDVRSDVYSFGVLTYQMLTRRLPNDAAATFEELAFQPHPPLMRLPEAVRQTLEIATAYDRERRWPTVAAYTEAFQAACNQDYPATAGAGGPPEADPVSLAEV